MKFVVNTSRILIGLLFILSGLIKLNDPTGFSYKMDEYFTVFADDLSPEQDTIQTTIQLGDQTFETTTALLPQSKVLSYTVMQSAWSYVGEDSTRKSTVSIIQNGNPVHEFALSTKIDSGYSNNLSFKSSINGSEIDSKAFPIKDVQLETSAHDVAISEYVKPPNWAVNLFNALRDYALFVAIFMSWLEAILGFALLIGWQRNFTMWMLILITVFFGFLTLYSWIYDKVTDCGCFGDAIPMNPEESFYKNVVIGVFVLLLYWGKKHITPVFSNSFAVKVLTVLTLLLVGFSMYCKQYLPVVDFLHYSEGTDIRAQMVVPDGERAADHVITTYLYEAKDGSGAQQKVVYDSDKNSFEPKIDYSKWKYVDVVDEQTLEEAYEPPIHDFVFYDKEQTNNFIEDFWLTENKLLMVMHDVKKANEKAMPEIREIAAQWKELGHPFWALTASSPEEVEEFRHKHQLSDIEFYYGDNTNIKSIIRSNPGLLLITDTSKVKRVWPSTRLPKFKKIVKHVK